MSYIKCGTLYLWQNLLNRDKPLEYIVFRISSTAAGTCKHPIARLKTHQSYRYLLVFAELQPIAAIKILDTHLDKWTLSLHHDCKVSSAALAA